MNEQIGSIVMTLISTFLPTMVIYFWKRAEDKKAKDYDAKAEERKLESRLSMKLMVATSKLSYANAIAIEQGRCNGELKDAKAEYEQAMKEYKEFLFKVASENTTL